jgi:hypothetical protein
LKGAFGRGLYLERDSIGAIQEWIVVLLRR